MESKPPVPRMAATLAGLALPKLAFAYDASGNRSLIRRNHSATTSEAMGYTADSQLGAWTKGTADASGAIASPTSSQSWALDSHGNWSTWTQNGTAQTRTHTSANELTAMGAASLTWDAAGNLTSDGTLTYVWGPRGTLDTVKQGSTVKGFYGYDPLGRRALKTVGSLKTISIYDGWQCVWQKVTGSGTDTTKAVAHGNYIDEPVAMIRKWGSSTDTSYYLRGVNYNVEVLTDRTGSVIERYEYTPYGKPTIYTGVGSDGKWFSSDDVSATVSAKGNNILFQGRELDPESGSYFNRERYFAPNLGRFDSRDPLRMKGDAINPFRFVGSAPFSFTDPLGLKCTVFKEDLAASKDYLISTKLVGYEYQTFRSTTIGFIASGKPDPNTPGYNQLNSGNLLTFCWEGKVGAWYNNTWAFKALVRETVTCCEGCDNTQNCQTTQKTESIEEVKTINEYLPFGQPTDFKRKFGFIGLNPCRNSSDLPFGFHFGGD